MGKKRNIRRKVGEGRRNVLSCRIIEMYFGFLLHCQR